MSCLTAYRYHPRKPRQATITPICDAGGKFDYNSFFVADLGAFVTKDGGFYVIK